MATLSRVDSADLYDRPAHVDLPDADSEFFAPVPVSEEDRSGVAARPSREFSAYDETVEIHQAPRGPWLGLMVFVGVMVSIISAAAVVALEENGQPALADMARSAVAELPDVELPSWELPSWPAERRVAKPRRGATVAVAPAAAPRSDEANRLRPEPAVAPAASAPTVTLPEIVMERPQLETKKPEAAAPQRRAIKARHVARRIAKLAAPRAAKPAPVVAKAPAAAASASSWDDAREAARQAYAAGRYGDAVAAYEQAVRANPGHALTLAGLGAARMQTGDLAGAVDAYQRAAKLAPDNASVQVALARACERSGDTARARALYKRVLTLDPQHPAARAALERL